MQRINFSVEQLQSDLDPQDMQDILGLYQVLSPSHGLSDDKVIDNLVEITLSERDAMFVARLESSRIVGMGGVHLVRKGLGLEARLEDVATHKDYEGNGIGRTVVGACVEWARAHTEDWVELNSASFRERANGLYESMGFELRPTNVRRLNLSGPQNS